MCECGDGVVVVVIFVYVCVVMLVVVVNMCVWVGVVYGFMVGLVYVCVYGVGVLSCMRCG